MIYIVAQDFIEWREHARELLMRAVLPENITWQTEQCHSLVFDDEGDYLRLPCVKNAISMPREFVELAKNVACFRDDTRWSLLYSVAWRIQYEDRNILQYTVDDQVSRLFSMQKSVGRDKHKMKAFVRFKKVCDIVLDQSSQLAAPLEALEHEQLPSPSSHHGGCSNVKTAEYFAAWFEPEHYIVPALMPFFIKRFNNMCWSILTRDICAHWDCEQLTYTQGLAHPPEMKDDEEELWKEYYKNIFNPARLKLKAMQAEMPKKYWKNLPEAPLIAELTRSAHYRSLHMVEESTTSAWKKTEKSKYVKEKQKALRARVGKRDFVD